MVERSFKYLDEIELSFVRGIGEKKFASLKKSKLKTVADLIRYFPRTHIDRSKVKLISEIDKNDENNEVTIFGTCLLYTSPSPRDRFLSRMPSSA